MCWRLRKQRGMCRRDAQITASCNGLGWLLGEQKVYEGELLLNIKITGVGYQLKLGTDHGEG